jgi:hypothetical protein
MAKVKPVHKRIANHLQGTPVYIFSVYQGTAVFSRFFN